MEEFQIQTGTKEELLGHVFQIKFKPLLSSHTQKVYMRVFPVEKRHCSNDETIEGCKAQYMLAHFLLLADHLSCVANNKKPWGKKLYTCLVWLMG